MVNSELTETACKILYKVVDGDSTYNLYTGYKQNSSAPEIYSLKSTIESMIDSLSGKSILVACHEMPFTVINDIYLKDTTNVLFLELDRSL